MINVIIPTSGVGSRLDTLTAYTNKSLVKVGDKLAISRILEAYPADANFFILTGHYGDFVRQYVEIAHPDLNCTFVAVENYDSAGSSLALSLLSARRLFEGAFFLHCCDSLLESKIDHEYPANTCFLAKCNGTAQYTCVATNENVITAFYDKNEQRTDFAYVGIAYIRDAPEFWSALELEYSERPTDRGLNDVAALRRMQRVNKIDVQFVVTEDWYDIGNTDALQVARNFFGSNYHVLNKDQESISFVERGVVKFFYDKEICLNRVKRANDLKEITPRIIDYRENFFVMEYVDGDLLSDIADYKLVRELVDWAENYLWTKKPGFDGDRFAVAARKFYVEKTRKRIQSFLEKNPRLDCKVINGLEVGSALQLLDQIDFKIFEDSIPSNFHGDFILDNIFRVSEGFKLIDWRQDFAGSIDFGDKYYDLAKLRHSLIFNHENIDSGLYYFSIKNNECTLDLNSKFIHFSQLKTLDFICENNGLDTFKIRVLTSLIWLNMAALHDSPLNGLLHNLGKFTLALELMSE